MERRQSRQFALALEAAVAGDAQFLLLRNVAAGLAGAGAIIAPSAEFSDALRVRLLNTAPAAVARPTTAHWRRRLVAAGAVLTISTGGVAATAVASTHALPGDRLYEVKRAVEGVQLALANGDRAKGDQYLSIAATRLSEVQALLARDGSQSADPVVVQELRDTLSDMSDALASGSNHLFAAFGHYQDPKVLAPLADFVDHRTTTLNEMRALLPVELLPKQDSLIGEVQSIAARVASATGTPAPAVDRTVQTTPLNPAPAAARASRSDADREDLSHLTDPTVNSVDDAVASARENAKSASAKHSQRSHREQTDVERDVRSLVDTDLFDPAARPSLASSSDDPADSDSAGPLRPTPAGMSSAGGSFLLGLLPLPDDSIDTMIPGSLTAGLDFSLAQLGGHYSHLASDR
jgi:hypothetical protein